MFTHQLIVGVIWLKACAKWQKSVKPEAYNACEAYLNTKMWIKTSTEWPEME